MMDPNKIVGKYHMVRQKNFDQFLKAVGNTFKIQFIQTMNKLTCTHSYSDLIRQ